MTHELFTIENLTYITAETVCELLCLVAGAHQGIPISVILDNARYQRCALVQAVAQELGIELLYLPTYSPNLNLIERLNRLLTLRFQTFQEVPVIGAQHTTSQGAKKKVLSKAA